MMARYSHKGHNTISHKISWYDTIRSESASPYVRTVRPYSGKQATAHNTGAPRSAYQHYRRCRCRDTGHRRGDGTIQPTGEATVGGSAGARFLWSPGSFRLSTAAIVIVWRPHGRRAVARLKYLVIAQSQSTHQPTREAGQLLTISVTLPAPATLHETPFVDVTEGIYHDMLVTKSCAKYRLRLTGNYRTCHDTISISRYSIRY